MLTLSGSLVLVVLLTGMQSKLIADKMMQVDIMLCINMCERSQTKESTHYCLCTMLDKNDTNVSLAGNYRQKVVVKFEKWPTKDESSCIETSKHFGKSRVQFLKSDRKCILQASNQMQAEKKDSCSRIKATERGVEMNCISCTNFKDSVSDIIEMDHYCHAVNGYTVCNFVKDKSVCTCTTKTVNCSLENTVSKLEDYCGKPPSPAKQSIEFPKDAVIQEGSIWIKYTPFCAMSWDVPTNEGISRKKRKCSRPLKGLWKENYRDARPATRKRFFTGSESINCFTSEGETPIMVASSARGTKVIDHLLYVGVDLSPFSKKGWNVIHYAVTSEWGIIVKRFVDLGIDPELRTTKDGKTPLLLAVEHNCVLVIRYLLKIGCDPNAVSNLKHNVLHLAVLHETKKILYYLKNVRLKHLLDDKDVNGKTPVELAKQKGKTEALKEYIKY